MKKAIIDIRNVSYGYTALTKALEDISFEIYEGEIFSIIGTNGSGKSTLLNIIAGLIFPNKGELFYKEKPVNKSSLKNNEFNKSFRSSLGIVFQNPDSQLFCPTVWDELMFGPLQTGISQDVAKIRTQEILKMLEIEQISDRPVYMLSGGEKKKVAIASVLTMNPEVLVFDEPTSGLDPKTRSFLTDLIFHLNDIGKTIIITTHNLQLVSSLQARVAVISEEHRMERIADCESVLNDIDFLVKMNLIGENVHKHGNMIHRHIPNDFIKHEHKNKH